MLRGRFFFISVFSCSGHFLFSLFPFRVDFFQIGASIIIALNGVGRVRLNSRFWGDLRSYFFFHRSGRQIYDRGSASYTAHSVSPRLVLLRTVTASRGIKALSGLHYDLPPPLSYLVDYIRRQIARKRKTHFCLPIPIFLLIFRFV